MPRDEVSTSSSYIKGHKGALCSTTPYSLCSSYIYGTVPLPVPDVFMGGGGGGDGAFSLSGHF
jgi:hypothetical protein